MNTRCCIIRNSEEAYVLREHLTPAELAEVEERKKSPTARRRFAARLGRVRRAGDAPLKAALKAALDAKMGPRGNKGNMISLLRANEIRRLIDGRLREFTTQDIRRADPAVFAVPWVPDLTPEERNFERKYREQKLIEIRAFLEDRKRKGH